MHHHVCNHSLLQKAATLHLNDKLPPGMPDGKAGNPHPLVYLTTLLDPRLRCTPIMVSYLYIQFRISNVCSIVRIGG